MFSDSFFWLKNYNAQSLQNFKKYVNINKENIYVKICQSIVTSPCLAAVLF